MESGGQDVVVPETPRSGTPTECDANGASLTGGTRGTTTTTTTTSIRGVVGTDQHDLSTLQRFYAQSNIFITGSTGYLGKLLVQKLLRTCADISNVYLLIRQKKGQKVDQRLEQIFDDPVFEALREEQPKYRHKVVAIAGDCSLPGLGISEADRRTLIENVDIVFHVAATVRFDEKLKLAVPTNVQSPRDVIKLCKEMPQLRACIHVSTAYANCVQNPIEEKFYDVPISGDKLISLVENTDEKLIEDITKPLLQNWPNTYTFTKAVAENIVRNEAEDLPVGIFRPSVVISTYEDPLRGWIDNLYGPTGVAAGAGSGLLHSIHCDGSLKANVVPGDWTVHALIASAWDVAERRKDAEEGDRTIPIYNYTNKDNPITWDDLKVMTAKHGLHLPTVRAVWYYSFGNTKSKWLHMFYVIFLHLLPAYLAEGCYRLTGKGELGVLRIYKKIHKFMNVLNYFTTQEWQFGNENVRALAEKLDFKDRTLFPMDMREIIWDKYFQTYIKGIRIYLIKDPLDTLGKARLKWQILWFLHQAAKLFLVYVLWKLIYAVYSSAFGA
ncbi:unnamed protein product [Trichogramma brassicae]|uniref:Fatty acyl-CoA reductase n=1 Tax=Trichogramma brassicae TaxID=86971 RepID=A0A6H5HZQ8_9HYME|nr:unnamed protein product [Trichogramma brassicae]